MKIRTIGYWATTGIVALALAAGGAGQLARSADTIAAFAHLGYPAYVVLLLGIWKVLGAAALLLPRSPRLKEWAYAGLTFLFTGAAVSHAAVGDPAGKVITPLVLLALAATSWALRPKSRVLDAPSAEPTSDRAPAAAPAAA
jgi:uncharacterized membrane protein YphA (DoxX/SURF4 family)